MLQSVQEAMQSGKLQDILNERNELRYLNKIDECLLADLISLLKPFDEVSKHLSAENTPTIPGSANKSGSSGYFA